MSKNNDINNNSNQKHDEFASMSISELEGKLNSTGDGLSNQDAQSRLSQYGYNELEEKGENPLLKFLSYLWGPIPWMIEIAAILSALVKNWSDFGIITTLLVVNALVGFWEEHKAGNMIAALKKKLALNALIKRGGNWEKIPAREVVPGDVMRLRVRRHRPCRFQAHRRRPRGGRPIRTHRRIPARNSRARRRPIFRICFKAG